MHQSAFDHMRHFVSTYMETGKRYRVLDYGSRVVSKQLLRHRDLLTGYDIDYVGVDVGKGDNVDIVMKELYSVDIPDRSVDIIMCGQVFEHVPFFWASFLEMSRMLKVGGMIFLTAPSRGHTHAHPYDCWRFYQDGYKALAAFADLRLVEYRTDFPEKRLPNGRFDYRSVPGNRYWGDTVGVFQKTETHNEKGIAKVRVPLLAWANAHGDLDETVKQHGPLPLPSGAASPVTVHEAFGIKFPHRDDLINAKVKLKMQSGKYEIREAEAALKYLKGGERIVELGAGLGFMSTLIKTKRPPKSYVAIEADPRLVPYIKETHRLNGVSGVLVQNCLATSDPVMLERGFAEFQVARTFWGSSYKNVGANAETVRVEAVPLTNFLDNIDADVLIADIEGGEVDLFTGIDIRRLKLVILEMHPTVIGDEGVDKVFRELKQAGLRQAEYVDSRVAVYTR
jgi:FkbM family methyltransferase